MHHAAFSYTVSDTCRKQSDVCDNDYSFLRIERCVSFTGESIDPVCLMAQVSTDSSIDTSVRDTDSERSHPMDEFECYDNVDQIPRVFSSTYIVCMLG